MKYKVICWTNYDDEDFPEGECSDAAYRAIIDDVRANGYDFTGYAHQECFDCTPVLNNGERMCFSQRAWGRIMAEAHGHYGVFDYSGYSFGMTAESDKTPTWQGYSESDVVPVEDMYESYSVSVTPDELGLVGENKKIVLPDSPELRYVDTGDTVILSSGDESAEYKVSSVEHGRDKNGGKGSIDPITEYELESIAYSSDDNKQYALSLYEKGERIVIIYFE